jgi:cytochrome c
VKAHFRFAFVFAILFSLLVSGCGGGGGTGERPEPAAPRMVIGVAASGGPVVGAVLLKDSSSPPVQRTTTTASDGSFAFDTAGLTPPFILKTTAAGVNLYSIAIGAGVSNLTPLTTIATAQAAGGADLDSLYATHVQAEVSAAAAKMADAVAAVHKSLAPLMDRFGVTSNLLSGEFSANHTGIDALLDAISVVIQNGTTSIGNSRDGKVFFTAPSANLAAGTLVAGNMPSPAGTPAPQSGQGLYTAKCAGCHGAFGSTTLRQKTSASDIRNAIDSNRGGMGSLSGLTAADIQAISDALMTPPGGTNPPAPAPAPLDGAALYADKCAACHGPLATSSKKGMTVVRLQNAISGDVGGMGALASLTAADMQAIATALNAPGPAPAPTPAPTPTPSPSPDGAALYADNCAACHGTLANSTKRGITIARLQGAISSNSGGMGSLSSLTVTQIQAIVTALTPANPTPTPPAGPDGAALYASGCASCHGPLASSSVAGASAGSIQSAIAGNKGGMGSLSTLTPAQISAIAGALAGAAPGPIGGPACGSCHALPPATGRHSKHRGEGVSCAACHGSGFSTTTVNDAVHNNGVKNLVAAIGWKAAGRTCSNSCHKTESW